MHDDDYNDGDDDFDGLMMSMGMMIIMMMMMMMIYFDVMHNDYGDVYILFYDSNLKPSKECITAVESAFGTLQLIYTMHR